MIEIHSAEDPDVLEAARILIRAHVSTALDADRTDAIVAALPNPYTPPQGGLWVAYLDGIPAGSVALRQHEPEIGEVKRMFVAPEQRRMGVARALLLYVIQQARAAGYTRLRLGTLTTMHAAQGLYESEGFYSIPPYRSIEFGDTTFYELELESKPHLQANPAVTRL